MRGSYCNRYGRYMSHRRAAETVAGNIRSLAALAGMTPATIAEATDTDVSDVAALHSGATTATVTDIASVGGFFRVPAHLLLAGVSA